MTELLTPASLGLEPPPQSEPIAKAQTTRVLVAVRTMLGRATPTPSAVVQALETSLRTSRPEVRLDRCTAIREGPRLNPNDMKGHERPAVRQPAAADQAETPAFAGGTSMARPGLEPGTPRFSVVCSTN